MEKITTFFGYGSLMNKDSLQETIPYVLRIIPAFIRGYRREFGVWDPEGFTGENWFHTGEYALNIKKIADATSRVNGILICIPSEYKSELLRREDGYIEVYETAYDFYSAEKLGRAEVFEAIKDDDRFLFGSRDQEEYLKICLAGARSFGEEFYLDFIETTYIGEHRLSEIREIIKFL